MENMKASVAIARVILTQTNVNTQTSYILARMAATLDAHTKDPDLAKEFEELAIRNKSVVTQFEVILSILEGMNDG